MAGVRFEDVDLLGALSRIVDLHTQHYKEDFDLDKELISKLAVSDRSEDKQLLWMSRPCGTYTLREREVYLDGSHENKVWRFYQEQTNDPVLAYAISLKEVRDGKIFGIRYSSLNEKSPTRKGLTTKFRQRTSENLFSLSGDTIFLLFPFSL